MEREQHQAAEVVGDTAPARVPAKGKGVARILAATRYSVAGLITCFRNEEAFRIECVLAGFLAPAAFLLGETRTDIVLLLFTLVLVLVVELLNSCIEAVVDRIGAEYHEQSKRAKDMASAAVFLSLLFFLVVWAALLL